jgi:energy-coupling factor transporter ATP-binding protein EcfA2
MIMKITLERSSPWINEFQKRLWRGNNILLYGNIADQFLINGNYRSLSSFVKTYFEEEGYDIIAEYDLVDGLRYVNQKMQQEAQRLIRSAAGGEPSNGLTPPETTPAPGDSSMPPRRLPGAGLPPLLTQRVLYSPDQAFAAIRSILKQSELSTAVIVYFSDLLVGDADRFNDSERPQLVQLKKALQEASYIVNGSLAGRKNVLVLVAGQLGAVPSWLYKDNPFLTLIQIAKPHLEERKNFVLSFVNNFYETQALDAVNIARFAQEFADLTDGLTAWDFEAIRRTSVIEQIPLSNAKALVDFYKYGSGDDPWEKLNTDKIEKARAELGARVIGQSAAIEAVVNMLLAARVGISIAGSNHRSGKPKGVFFFVGPTGVGKTELAKALTALIFGDDTAFARFDMSEYAEPHAAEKLTGSPPGYVGYDEGGQLTNRVMERPFSVLLFDEIEKAHWGVMDKFLQILEDGRLTDGKGQTAYFSQSVIIFTSNIGSGDLDLWQASGAESQTYPQIKAHYMTAVHDHFKNKLGRPELLNRLGDNILVFDILREQYIEGICRKFLNALAVSAREKRGVELVYSYNEVIGMIQELMLQEDNLLFGGRRIKTLMEGYIERPLNRWIFFNDPPAGSQLHITRSDKDRTILINGCEVN